MFPWGMNGAGREEQKKRKAAMKISRNRASVFGIMTGIPYFAVTKSLSAGRYQSESVKESIRERCQMKHSQKNGREE